jgi:REP element-mobilizing transposase RayT
MRQLRVLQQGVWYEIRSRVNNREPLFRQKKALAVFDRVFRDTKSRFAFEVRRRRLEGDLLTFYIRPEEGLELPEIMKWMKQTFARRYNVDAGRTGHIWGDRYWSAIVEGEIEEGGGAEKEAGEEVLAPGAGPSDHGVRPHEGKTAGAPVFSTNPPIPPPLRPPNKP